MGLYAAIADRQVGHAGAYQPEDCERHQRGSVHPPVISSRNENGEVQCAARAHKYELQVSPSDPMMNDKSPGRSPDQN